MDSERASWWPKLIGAVLVLVVAWAVYGRFKGEDETISFESTEVKKETVEAFVAATGNIESTTTVTVGSQVSGPVSEVLVDFNSPVTKGQVLAEIDPSAFVAGLEARQASLQSAQAGLASAQASLTGQDASVRQAEVDVTAASIRLQQAKGQVDASIAGVANAKANQDSRLAEQANTLLAYQRAEDLVKRELVALSDRDQARTNYLVASAGVETAGAAIQQADAQLVQSRAAALSAENDIKAAESRLAVARAQRQVSAAQVSSAQASVAQAQAAVAQAEVDLQRTTITSPIDGVVINRKVDEGQTVAAQFQAPELFVIARNLEKMQVKAEVSEADIGRVTAGAPVKFSVDAYPGREFEGSVIQVRSAPDSDSTNTSKVVVYGVLVTADNPEQLLKPGMTATVEILAEKLENAVVIPGQALRYVPSAEDKKSKDEPKGQGTKPSPSPSPEQDKSKALKPGTRKGTVWVLEGQEPKRRDIVTGISVDDNVVVVDGDLKVGEKVVTSESGGAKKRGRFRLSI